MKDCDDEIKRIYDWHRALRLPHAGSHGESRNGTGNIRHRCCTGSQRSVLRRTLGAQSWRRCGVMVVQDGNQAHRPARHGATLRLGRGGDELEATLRRFPGNQDQMRAKLY